MSARIATKPIRLLSPCFSKSFQSNLIFNCSFPIRPFSSVHNTARFLSTSPAIKLPPSTVQKKLIAAFSTSSKKLKQKQEETSETVSADGKIVVDVSDHPIFKRIPKFLHPYTVGFMNAPVSHVTSFIIIHELTAVLPLFGLWGLFYYMDFTPTAGIPEWLLSKGTHFIDVLAERNGWTSLKTESGANLVLQGAAAYAIVKVLLPFRAAFSLIAMPWFARWCVIPVTRLFTKSGRKASKKSNIKATSASKEYSPIPDPKGNIWRQELPSDAPKMRVKSKDSDRPSL